MIGQLCLGDPGFCSLTVKHETYSELLSLTRTLAASSKTLTARKQTRYFGRRQEAMSELLGDRSYSYYGASMFIILSLGLIGNFLTVVVLLHPHHRGKSMTPLMMNLCVADLLVCLFGYTVAVNYNTADFANTGEAPALCFWLAFINTITGLASIGTLTAMAIITYLGISRNEIAQQNRMNGKTEVLLLSGKKALFCNLISITLFSLNLAILAIFKNSRNLILA